MTNCHIFTNSGKSMEKCPFCKEEISLFDYLHHLPKCSYRYQTENGVLLCCSCAQCKGTRTHPGDSIVKQGDKYLLVHEDILVPNYIKSSNLIDLEKEVPTPAPSPKKRRISEKNGLKILRITPTTLSGKSCIFESCQNKSNASRSPFPKIKIGTRLVSVCKKAHIAQEFEREQLRLILNEWKEEEDEGVNIVSENDIFCSGKVGQDRCFKDCSTNLWLEDKNGKRYFCSGECVLSYLAVEFGVKNKKIQETSQTQSIFDENTTSSSRK